MTSPTERILVECPRCRAEYLTSYRASINVDLDPDMAADEEYLREISTGTCPECGSSSISKCCSSDGKDAREPSGVEP